MQRIAAVVAATLLSGVDTTEVRSSSPSDGGAKCGYEDHVDTSYVDTSYMQMEFSTNAEVEMPAKKVEEFGIDTKGKGKRAADFIKEGAKAEDVDMKEPDKADDAAKVMPRAMDAMKDYQHTAVLKANDSSPAATPAPPPYDGVVVNGVSAFQVGSDYQICDPDPSSVLSGCHGASSGVTCTYTDCIEDCHADASCNFFYVVFAGPRLGRCKKLTSCPGMRTIGDLSNLYRTFKVQTQGPTPAPTPSTAQALSCKAFESWPDKDGNISCGDCKHLVLTHNFATCDAYCASFGQECFYAAEDLNGNDQATHVPNCQIDSEYTCSDDVGAANSGSSDMICGCRTTQASTPALTPAPTTPLAPTSQVVRAFGDPHLVNMLGQRFDVNQPGQHNLLLIPAAERHNTGGTLLSLRAHAERMGSACADMYFRSVNITGRWVPVNGGMHFKAASPTQNSTAWMRFRTVQVKVVRAKTGRGTAYLNILVKHLKSVPVPVGGLLGKDDHSSASELSPGCKHVVSL